MRKIICLLLSACILLCLTACNQNTEQPQTTENTAPTEDHSPTEGQSPTESEPPTESQIPTEGQPTTEPPEDRHNDNAEAVKLLTLEKSLYTYYEWDDSYYQAVVRSEHSTVTLSQEDAEVFPEMAEVLNQIATMQCNAMEDEFDNLVSFAREAMDINWSTFETYVSTLDVQVRRADHTVISLLSDSYSDYGQIEDYRAFHGSNYDTQSGKELALNDVIKSVNNDLAEAVEKELTGHTWTGTFHSEDAVENYFANTPYDGFSWTLDYNGVTFYFAPGDLCDEGAMTATISFEEYPEFFVEKYTDAPEEYTVELPQNTSFFTQLDEGGALEEISFSGSYNTDSDKYTDYGIYTASGEYAEECFVYAFHPYYIKANSGHYLYIFCEDFNEGVRQMELVVFSLNEDGSVTKAGEKNVSPSWLADNKFIAPTDPDYIVLDDADHETEKVAFTVGNNGMPKQAE